jgi:hypothetical protein
MTDRPPTRQRDSNPVPSQEDGLLDLLRKAEGYAYALAHGYDIGGHTERAYGLVALGERIRDTATDVSDLARPVEPHSVAPALGLRWRGRFLATAPERNRVARSKRGTSGAKAGRRVIGSGKLTRPAP